MRYVVKIGEDLWFAGIDDDRFLVSRNLEEAVVYSDPVAAARAVGRVDVAAPLLDPVGTGSVKMNMPLLLAGARVQRLNEAKEEQDGDDTS